MPRRLEQSPSPPRPPDDSSRPEMPFTPWELVLAALILLFAAGVRGWFPERMAVEHFDEGVYASGLWFSPEMGGHYPRQPFYAPPLLPNLLAAAQLFDAAFRDNLLPTPLAAMLPNLVFGVLTVLVVWLFAREWAGPAVGLAAAALAAACDFHVIYSRSALTDVLLTLLTVAALWMLDRSLRRRDYRSAVLGGVAIGAAWWTKYNGWLPILIAGVALAAATLMRNGARPIRLWHWRRWGAASAIGILCWLPYPLLLLTGYRYSEIAANHRRYIVGLAGWCDSLLRQCGNLRVLDGPLLPLMIVAVASAWTWRSPATGGLLGGGRRRDPWWAASLVAAIGLLAALIGGPAVLVLAATYGMMAAAIRVGRTLGQAANVAEASADAGLGWLMCSVWWLLLSALTPLYTAYSRLLLPWLCPLWILGALGLSRAIDDAYDIRRRRPVAWWSGWLMVVVCLAIGLAWQGFAPGLTHPRTWQPRTAVAAIGQRIGERLRTDHRPGEELLLIVYGEPALFHHLRCQGLRNVVPHGDPAVLNQDLPDFGLATYLVTGPHAHRDPAVLAAIDGQIGKFAEVERWPFQGSDLVLLEHFYPAVVWRRDAEVEAEHFRLYRLNPGVKPVRTP